MAGRRRIGLIFSYSEEWIAGSYYILNIINALKTLPRSQKPHIVIVSDDLLNFDIVKKETNYPHLEFVEIPIKTPKYNFFEKALNKMFNVLVNKKLINKKPLRANIEFLYPIEADVSFDVLKKINWVPDFQEFHLPQLFSAELIQERKKRHEEVVCKGDWVVFSSEDSHKDFKNLYPKASVKPYVLPFAVTHPKFEHLSILELLEKHHLPEKYYFAPNQFWVHKNHMVILRAIDKLKKEGVEIHLAFSGKEHDHRNADYVGRLKSYISENRLNNNVSFLGFIPRDEQLKLMQEAVAVVQPSKFEGWSTVVEDAKALNQFLIVSNLDVHHEQIDENAEFFNPDDAKELSEILNKYWESKPLKTNIDYNSHRIRFAENFMNMVDEMSI